MQEEEIKFQRFKDEVKTISTKHRKKTKDLSNLTENEKKGLESLREKIKSTEVLCYQTDKSGRWSCDSEENYKVACKKHLAMKKTVIKIKVSCISLSYEKRSVERDVNP